MKSLKNSPRLSAFYSKDKGKTSALIYSIQKLITATKNCLTGPYRTPMIFAFLRKLPASKYSLLLLKDDRADHHTSELRTLYAQEGASFWAMPVVLRCTSGIVLPSCSFPMKPCALFCLRLVSYQLLKRWIILSAGNVSIQEITQLVSLALIHCEVPGEKSFLCGMDFSPHKSLASLVSRERLSKC